MKDMRAEIRMLTPGFEEGEWDLDLGMDYGLD